MKLDAEQEKHWRKAFEIYELQKDLTQLHEQNFLLQRTLSEMEMDEKVLAIAVDADFPTVDTVKEGKCRAQPMFGDKEYVKAEKRSPIACRPNVLSPCRPQSNIDEWAGFIIPPGGDREGTPFEVFEQVSILPYGIHSTLTRKSATKQAQNSLNESVGSQSTLPYP